MTIAANPRAKPRLPVMAGPMFIASAHASNSRLFTVVKRAEPAGDYIDWLVADYTATRAAMGMPV